MENICRFIGPDPVPEVIQIFNFVYERFSDGKEKLSSVYKACIVTSGSAEVTVGNKSFAVKFGDVFFIFPAVAYCIKASAGFEYMFISYMGIRASALMERFDVNTNNCFYPDCGELFTLWINGIEKPASVFDLVTETVLLSTISFVGERNCAGKQNGFVTPSLEKFLQIKKYIDDNFFDTELSVAQIGKVFSYNQKYICSAFKRYFKIGISEYISTVRIAAACQFIEQGGSVVSVIAQKCGFADTAYFSKVFKKHIGVSPREYMENM